MQHAKNILLIGINYIPEPTGIGKYTGELGTYLSANGYKVQVVTAYPYYPQWKVQPGYKYYWYSREKIDGASVMRCPFYVPANPGGAKRMLQDLTFFLSALLAVTALRMRGRKYEAVVVASPSFMSGFVGLWYKLLYRRTCLVYHIQDLQVDAAEELGMIRQQWLIKILKKAEAFILCRADVVNTISNGMLQRIQSKNLPIQKLVLFPNWVNFSHIHRTQTDHSVLQSLNLPADKQLILYSGAVGEKQGLEIVLEVAERLQGTMPQLHFVIAGNGPYAEKLQQQAGHMQLKNIQFIPLQPLSVFNHLLNAAWLHLIIQKGKASDLLLPSKLTNILAVGGLVLVTSAPGSSLYEIIQEHEAGYLIAPDDPAAFYEGIAWLQQNPNHANKLKDNAARYAGEYLEQKSIINRFLEQIGLATALPNAEGMALRAAMAEMNTQQSSCPS